jgi:hypothetical protein
MSEARQHSAEKPIYKNRLTERPKAEDRWLVPVLLGVFLCLYTDGLKRHRLTGRGAMAMPP